MKFKERLKSFREENNMTQSDLASKLFVSRTLISKWENGVIYPSSENMNKLADLMNVNVNTLLSEEETKMIVLDNNSKNFSLAQKIIYALAIILISSGITLLIVGFVFPSDLTRPEDLYNSVNTITVICLIMKIFGAIMTFIGVSVFALKLFMNRILKKK